MPGKCGTTKLHAESPFYFFKTKLFGNSSSLSYLGSLELAPCTFLPSSYDCRSVPLGRLIQKEEGGVNNIDNTAGRCNQTWRTLSPWSKREARLLGTPGISFIAPNIIGH